MNKISHALALLAVTLWVGGIGAMGYLAVPVLFQTLADKQLAGMLAGKLFSVTAYLGIICGVYLLAYYLVQLGSHALKQKVFWVAAIMLLLTLIGQFGIQPILADLKAQALPMEVMKSALAGSFRTWHGVASIMYLVQSILGVALVIMIGMYPVKAVNA